MDKAGKEGKSWISGLFDYRVAPQSGSIAPPLQLMTQHSPREKNLPQLPTTLGAPKIHQAHQELIKGKGTTVNLKGSTKNYSQVHQFGCNTSKMLHRDQQ